MKRYIIAFVVCSIAALGLLAPKTATATPGRSCNPPAGHGNPGCHRAAPSPTPTPKPAPAPTKKATVRKTAPKAQVRKAQPKSVSRPARKPATKAAVKPAAKAPRAAASEVPTVTPFPVATPSPAIDWPAAGATIRAVRPWWASLGDWIRFFDWLTA